MGRKEGEIAWGFVSVVLIVGGDCGTNSRSKIECISGVALAVNGRAADKDRAPLRYLGLARGAYGDFC